MSKQYRTGTALLAELAVSSRRKIIESHAGCPLIFVKLSPFVFHNSVRSRMGRRAVSTGSGGGWHRSTYVHLHRVAGPGRASCLVPGRPGHRHTPSYTRYVTSYMHAFEWFIFRNYGLGFPNILASS